MFVEIHMLQNHAPSNLNRDEIGAPKSAVFGGIPRARISSQCLKRSIRLSEEFRTALAGKLGQRTVAFPELVQSKLPESTIPSEQHPVVVTACTRIAQAEDKEKEGKAKDAKTPGGDEDRPRTAQLIFLDPQEAEEVVQCLADLRTKMPDDYCRFLKVCGEGKKDKDPSKKFWERLRACYGNNGVDIALFGRMTTSPAFEDVEAAMEVAHAISTTEFTPEVDYFTAVDDIPGRQGAAYLEDAQFGSATFYKYFSLDWQALLKNLGGDAELGMNVVRAFVHAAAKSVPSGKRNSFANNNLPDGILIEVKSRRVATNYANAFLVPARASSDHAGDHDVMADSIRKLSHYSNRLRTGYSIAADAFWFAPNYDLPFEGAARQETLDEMVDAVVASIRAKEADHASA